MWYMVIYWYVRVLMMHLGKITITAWSEDASASRNHVNHASTPSGVSIYVAPLVPSGVCLHLSSRLPELYIYIQYIFKKSWLHFGCDIPFPQLDPGPRCGIRVTREKDVQAPTGATHGAVGKRGMENDKTGCPSSFPLNTDPKSILLSAWDFLQPKFWVNPISCPQDWDVVCQRWQSSPEHGRRGPAFLIRRRSISSSRRRNYH